MWNEAQRNILTITLSGRVHQLDPLPVLRRYRAGVRKMGPEVFAEAIKEALEGKETPDIGKALFPILYEVMGWKSFTDDPEHGYTEMEVLGGITQFLDWLIDSKKKGETSPPSATSAGDSGETQPMPSIADSSSAGASSNPEGLGMSALAAT